MKRIGRVNKKDTENFAGQKRSKRAKRTRFSPKKAKPGAFWVLEGMGTVANRCERIEKDRKARRKSWDGLGLACRLGWFAAERHWHALAPRHALRRAQPCLVAKTFGMLTKNGEVSTWLTSPFLAGAEGLEPSARGFGVDVEERKRERGRGGVARFLLQDENVRCWFGAFRFSRSKTRIESPLEISLRMSSLKSYICMYTEE